MASSQNEPRCGHLVDFDQKRPYHKFGISGPCLSVVLELLTFGINQILILDISCERQRKQQSKKGTYICLSSLVKPSKEKFSFYLDFFKWGEGTVLSKSKIVKAISQIWHKWSKSSLEVFACFVAETIIILFLFLMQPFARLTKSDLASSALQDQPKAYQSQNHFDCCMGYWINCSH